MHCSSPGPAPPSAPAPLRRGFFLPGRITPGVRTGFAAGRRPVTLANETGDPASLKIPGADAETVFSRRPAVMTMSAGVHSSLIGLKIWRKSASMLFFNALRWKCDFRLASFSTTCSRRNWRHIPMPRAGRRKTGFFTSLLTAGEALGAPASATRPSARVGVDFLLNATATARPVSLKPG